MAWNMSQINQITYKPNNQVPFPPPISIVIVTLSALILKQFFSTEHDSDG